MKELPIGTCRHCDEEFRMKRNDQVFCGSVCRQVHYRIKELRGAKAIDLLISWRKSRGSKKGVLGELAAMVDGWIKEDRK